jgi:YidC/Oxa1 family membrane protein insertase
MELYKERGVNPFGGCLPLLIQMPILFGLFRATSNMDAAISGQRFLWVGDLSIPEPMPWAEPAGIPFLLIILVASQYAYQRFLTPPSQGGDAQAEAIASMTKFMPLLFAFFFYTLDAGVLLYYTAFNVASLVQQVSLNRSLSSHAAAVPSAVVPVESSDAEAPAKQERTQNDAAKRRRRSKKR